MTIPNSFKWGLTVVERSTQEDMLFSLIDISGNTIFHSGPMRDYYSNENRIGVLKDGKWGFIDHKGVLVIPLQYSNAQAFNNGLARVNLNSLCKKTPKYCTSTSLCIDQILVFESVIYRRKLLKFKTFESSISRAD